MTEITHNTRVLEFIEKYTCVSRWNYTVNPNITHVVYTFLCVVVGWYTFVLPRSSLVTLLHGATIFTSGGVASHWMSYWVDNDVYGIFLSWNSPVLGFVFCRSVPGFVTCCPFFVFFLWCGFTTCLLYFGLVVDKPILNILNTLADRSRKWQKIHHYTKMYW